MRDWQGEGLMAMTDTLGPDTHLVAVLERYEQTLLKARQSVLSMAACHSGKPSQHSQRITTVAASCATACARAFESVHAYRWELMEQAADADIAAGRVHTFSTADELLSQLQA